MQRALLHSIVVLINCQRLLESTGEGGDHIRLALSAIANKWRPVVRRYGNTSSASVWYALGYIEACQGVRAGETVWQVGFGLAQGLGEGANATECA